MAEPFDVGPLLWVKEDIDQSLDYVLEGLKTINDDTGDSSALRFSQTYLYQVSGAYDMVGLEGCKLFCNQLEKAVLKIDKQELAATPDVVSRIVDAIHALKAYTEDLLAGGADMPARLYPALQPVMQAMDEVFDETALFFPDISQRVPSDVGSKELSDEAYTTFVLKQRLDYQKGLLAWIQTKADSAVATMYEAVNQVTLAQHNPKTKTLWWAASAFIESLTSATVANKVAAKKVCRKLDQALRKLVNGDGEPSTQLLRDVLYFVAHSDVDKASVQSVKSVFSLESLVEKADASNMPSAHEIKLVAGLAPEIQGLRDIWQRVSDNVDLEKTGMQLDDTPVALDNVLITQFSDKLNANQAAVATLKQQAFVDLYLALFRVSVVLRDDESKATQGALIDVASALSLLDDALSKYQHIDADLTHRLAVETTALVAVETGGSRPAEAKHDGLDKETMLAVVKDMQASLKTVEQSLDTFFRNPNDKATLSLTPKPLKQITAIFDMLTLPEPMQVTKACSRYVQYFQHDDYHENQADFELLAESLSLVGLYVDEMPNVRPETTTNLIEGLTRLNEALADVAFVEEETEEIEVADLDVPVLEQRVDAINKATEAAAEEVAEMQASTKVVDRAFDDALLDIYLTEAEEVVGQIAQKLQSLRVDAGEADALLEVRRSYHTLKGSGRTVGVVGQAEVAAGVETVLNAVLENDSRLSHEQVAQLEKITSAFADWLAELKAKSEVSVDQDYWLDQVQVLQEMQAVDGMDAVTSIDESTVTSGEEVADEPVETAEKEAGAYVLISGKHRVSKQLYDIFLNESMQNVGIIEQDVAKLKDGETKWPEKRARQAVHTLASNALASGFKPMGELCRALEAWLDAVAWTSDSLSVYADAVKAVARMWQSISNLKMPRAARSLVKLLNEAVEASQTESATLNDSSMDVREETPVTQQANAMVGDDTETKAVSTELLAMFIEEANTILPEVGAELRAWKATPTEQAHAGELQRLLHTLKGSARMAGQLDTGDTAHKLEELVVQKAKTTPTADDFESMFIELDKIVEMFDKPAADTAAETVNETNEPLRVQPLAEPTHSATSALRLREETLDRLINDAGEVAIIRSRIDKDVLGFKEVSTDLTESVARMRNYLRELEIEAESQMQSRMNMLQEANENFDPLEFDRFTRLQELTRMIAESVSDVDTIQHSLLSNVGQTEAALQQQGRMSRDLQQRLLGVRMLPFQQIAERLQSIVRQTARELDKQVDLIIEGATTEIDRGVLEKISPPLEHLLRNAVAHGIESKASRVSAGKAEVGEIRLSVTIKNDETHITLKDDGAGVDLERVKKRAVESGLLEVSAEVNEETLLSVIFEPGFSTADTVTQISGRGVGLDVVRSDISGLGGRVDMSSQMGQGATFNIYLPVTQSVAQVLLVSAGNKAYALPVAMVEQAQKIKHEQLLAAYNAGYVEWGGTRYPIYHFGHLLGEQPMQDEVQDYASVLLLRSGVNIVALHVDEVLGNQEIVMKEIGSQLARVPGVVGASVAGDGEIILIMNPVLIANRNDLSLVRQVSNQDAAPQSASKKLQALVVDDSLTMRKVLGRLLAREGYQVHVAKDGMDAMQWLQLHTPDIILTDIEMPRLDGFGLSRNIRDDERTENTPLIMISSRTADKHQKLAKEIGVDAFFGKPVQDEALLEKMDALLAAKK